MIILKEWCLAQSMESPALVEGRANTYMFRADQMEPSTNLSLRMIQSTLARGNLRCRFFRSITTIWLRHGIQPLLDRKKHITKTVADSLHHMRKIGTQGLLAGSERLGHDFPLHLKDTNTTLRVVSSARQSNPYAFWLPECFNSKHGD